MKGVCSVKYLKQIGLILLFSFLGEVCRFLIPLNIPGSIYGMILLFGALSLKLIRVEHVRETGSFITSLLPLLFPFALISLLVTALVMAAAGLVTKRIIRKGEKWDE